LTPSIAAAAYHGGGFIILLYATNMVLKGLCRNIEVYESWDLLNIMKKIDI
jgi:pentatricopeptide repeat protein